MGPIPPSRKKLPITETGNSNKQCYMGSSTTTCLTPNDDYIKQTSQDGINMGPGGKATSWQTQGDLAQNCREGENSFGVRFVEWGGGGCPWPCGMAGESVRPYTHPGLWLNDEWWYREKIKTKTSVHLRFTCSRYTTNCAMDRWVYSYHVPISIHLG